MTFKQSPLYKRYKYLQQRYTKSYARAQLLMAKRKNGTISSLDREYQDWERSRVALDSFIVATLQLITIAEEKKNGKVPHSK